MRQIVLWLSTLALSGCTAGGAVIETDADTPADGLRYTPDWDGLVALSDDSCISCHAPGATAGNLPIPLAIQVDLALGNGLYVVPFEPQQSRLWRVLSGEIIDGDYGVMPLAIGPLDLTHIDHVRLWIEDGAPFPPLPIDDDGDGVAPDDGDCDDSDPAIHPGAEELCDGVDNDCDGTTDGPDAGDATLWFADGDLDGFGDDGATETACEIPAGFVALGGDCNDADSGYNPSAVESDCADPNDYNCDGATGLTDSDGDGFGACEECDDSSADNFPGAEEVCDDFDNDCDGIRDEGVPGAPSWWRDDDGDGYGTGVPFVHCTGTSGWVEADGDCNDSDDAVNPGIALDVADGVDNDCDGVVDEDANAVSHAVDIQPILNNYCTATCHAGFLPSDGLNLSPATAYGQIVGVTSNDVGSMARIEPGDPSNSYLWHKVNNTHTSVGGTGSKMPKGIGNLTANELTLVEDWIAGGALP